ncbi:prolipoprotein diacylglyceryl transferase [Candidatus Pacearchaeota archaeon]|nr:prolipoprotein diacylglyceryl transferase [Candidatus Pacearchaeota archaeon]
MIDPIILKLGNFQVGYYSLIYILGFLAGLFILLIASKKKEIGLKEEQIYDLIVLLIFGIIMGARLFHILFWDFNYFLSYPIKILYIWEGGFSFHGGLLGASLIVIIFSRWNKINVWKLADILIIPAILFLAFGRLANFINQEIVGTITNVAWCVNFEDYFGCRHPVQLYGAFGRFALFTLLLFIKENFKSKQGFLFWISILLIGVGRFFTDFLREDLAYYGLNPGQWISLIMIIISCLFLWNFKR